jgi:hypothetical protein
MHLQQTKRLSRDSGGPQYYFHNLTDPVKTYLRKKGAVRVALVTPYGATKSDYFAVSKDHKFDTKKRLVSGSVGHDRIQQGIAEESIGEAIRKWYSLPEGDFERIDIDLEIIDDIFYLTPIKYKFASLKREITLARKERPLTFTMDYKSPLWREQIENIRKQYKQLVEWSLKEICRIVGSHKEKTPYIKEQDILRASGPLKLLGVSLGPYVGKGYDCYGEFRFLKYPIYGVFVEIKRNSKNFSYQMKKYGKDELSRAVILCAVHDLTNVPRNIDVIELDSLCHYIANI